VVESLAEGAYVSCSISSKTYQNTTDQLRTSSISPAAHPDQSSPPISTNEPQKDHIHTEYHEKSGRAAKTSRLEDYRAREPAKVQPPPRGSNLNDKPWSPFKSRADFEFAEVTLEAALSKKQIEKLIKISQRCINGEDTFNLTSHREICEIWTDASAMVSPVSVSYLFR
jgi:hypothetical protein